MVGKIVQTKGKKRGETAERVVGETNRGCEQKQIESVPVDSKPVVSRGRKHIREMRNVH